MKFLVLQKFRFDIGQSFLALLNFSFVILAASDKISSFVGLPAKVIVPIVVPSAMIAVWAIGYFLDRGHFVREYQSELNRRNQMLQSVHDKLSD